MGSGWAGRRDAEPELLSQTLRKCRTGSEQRWRLDAGKRLMRDRYHEVRRDVQKQNMGGMGRAQLLRERQDCW